MGSSMSKFWQNSCRWTRENQTKILTGMGIACALGAIGSAIVGTVYSVRAIDQEIQNRKTSHVDEVQVENDTVDANDIRPSDVAIICWKYYIPTAALTIASIAFHLGAESTHSNQYAAVATACTLSETAFREYKEKLIENKGEKEHTKILDAISKDRVENEPVTNGEVIITERGNTLCYDVISGRYFSSDIDAIKRAENVLNRQMRNDMFISLNEFFYEIGLPALDMGDRMGWNIDRGYIDTYFSSQLTPDGRPCVVVNHNNAPCYDYV